MSTTAHAPRRRTAPREVTITPTSTTLADALIDAFAAHLAQQWARAEAAQCVIQRHGYAMLFCQHDGHHDDAARLVIARPLLRGAASHLSEMVRECLLRIGVFVGTAEEGEEFAAALDRTAGRWTP